MLARGLKLSDTNFEWVCDTIRDASGIQLNETKRDLVHNRLARRLRLLGIEDFPDYKDQLMAGNDEEMVDFVNALTTNVTAFYRESHHFEFLEQELVPTLRARGQRKIRIWSAGCSMGMEPYTIAMTLNEAFGGEEWDARILATDLDTNVLEKAAQGVYSLDELEGVPASLRSKYLMRGKGDQDGMGRVKPALQEMVTFRQLNLMDESWPFHGPFDLIFCRNVVIYFDRPTQQKLFRRYAGLLEPEGILCIGHSEAVSACEDVLQPIGRSMYRRK
jgi:chemotaxis protein methyltransferase CheR